MAKSTFDYEGALKAGYTDEEITPFLVDQYPDFDYEGAVKSGYSPQEVNKFLSTYKPERSTLEKAGRVASQFGTAALETATLPYDIATAPLASKDAQLSAYRENLSEDLERLLEQKSMGQWDDQDQELYDSIVNQIKNPEESRQFIQTADVSTRRLIEKATGADLQPEGFIEQVANFAGWVKNPSSFAKILSSPFKTGNFIKNLLPTGQEAFRAVGAATGLEMAKEGEFGPIGQMGAMVLGDVVAGGVGKVVTRPKQTLAEVLAMFSKKDATGLQKQIIQDAKEAGIQLDAGTMTDSNLVKMIQTRLAQSGLVGKELRELKNQIEQDVIRSYGEMANQLGELKFSTLDEAGVAMKEGLTEVRNKDLQAARDFYSQAEEALKEDAFVQTEKINKTLAKLEKKLTPGQVKGGEQSAVLDIVENLKRDVQDSTGAAMVGDVRSLINDKIALNDIINYEVQGGSKQLLKEVVKEIDEAILSHAKENARFAKNYAMANRKFANHAETFRGREMSSMLRSENPELLLKKMDTISGLKRVENALSRTKEGKQLFQELKRYKVQELIGDKLINSEANQIKTGTFSKLFDKNKDFAYFKELMGDKAFKDFQKLTKNVSRVNDTMTRFYNASQSGTVAVDVAAILSGLSAISQLLMGNPWPIMKTGAVFGGAKGAAKLLSDPEFLKLLAQALESRGGASLPETERMLRQLSLYFGGSTDEENP